MTAVLAWGAKVSPAFRDQVVAIAAGIGVDPSWLMACMQFESGISPSIRNELSGATGLIQFMPSTAEGLGTTVDELAKMTAEAQLNFVATYFAPYKGRLKTFADTYMAILWPAAIGAPEDEIIFGRDTVQYKQNKSLDVGGKGYVTKGDAASFPARSLAEGLQARNSYDTGEVAPGPITQTRPTEIIPMGAAIALLPLLAQFIPQIIGLIKPGSASAAQTGVIAQTILNTAAQAAGVLQPPPPGAPPVNATAADVGATIDKLHNNPEMVKRVQEAVLTEPSVMAQLQIVEVGGGPIAARKSDLVAAAASEPFYKVSAVFWVSVLLLPIVYWLVGSLIVGGTVIPDNAPWFVQMLKIFGGVWNGESRSGGFNLVIGLVLGGICGVYYGISVTQNKQQASSGSIADRTA